MATHWWYKKGDLKFGPFSALQLKAFAKSGHLTPQDLVNEGGSADWKQAKDIQGLLFPSITSWAPSQLAPMASTASAGPAIGGLSASNRSSPSIARKTESGVSQKSMTLSWGGCGTILLSCFICSGIGVFVGDQRRNDARHTLDEANRFWELGHDADGVVKYKALLAENSHFPDAADTGLVFSRVIEFEVQTLHLDSARRVIEEALSQKVQLTLSKEAEACVARIQKEDDVMM